MSHLSDLIQSYLDAHPAMNKQQFAERAGVKPQSLSGWLNGSTVMKEYPEARHMRGLADAMGLEYTDVLHAITLDLGHPVARQQFSPEIAVTVASLTQLPPRRAKAVAQIIATMIGEETD